MRRLIVRQRGTIHSIQGIGNRDTRSEVCSRAVGEYELRDFELIRRYWRVNREPILAFRDEFTSHMEGPASSYRCSPPKFALLIGVGYESVRHGIIFHGEAFRFERFAQIYFFLTIKRVEITF